MVIESTYKENYLNWYGELITVVYQGEEWVYSDKEECFNHRHCFKFLVHCDNKKMTDI